MRISYDPAKRAKTIEERGLDFEDARHVFDGPAISAPDLRFDYGEERFVTFGYLRGRMVSLCWTAREGGRRIISMRYANDREQARYRGLLGGH
ncbi:BrnT family toxin [Methyloraptor flagellatus]|uniref:BrnT family toxin n=1 Tax=Methyloraptor flagellatus TaxID=3162530 RepID=A0AAU7XDN0_9HYPH